MPLPFGLSRSKGQLRKGLHSLGVACRMGTLCKSPYSLIPPTPPCQEGHTSACSRVDVVLLPLFVSMKSALRWLFPSLCKTVWDEWRVIVNC